MKKGVDFIGLTVVSFNHDGNGRFVMHKRSQNCRDERGKWDIGGGAIEHGDPVLDSLSKEIKEEYCCEVLEPVFLGYRDVHREHEGTKTHWLALDFMTRVNPDEVAIGEPHKFDDLRWFTKDEIPESEELHSVLPLFFDNYADRLWS